MTDHVVPDTKTERRLHTLFIVIVVWRGIYGAFEILLGCALLFTTSLANLAHTLVQGELMEDPTDVVAVYLNHAITGVLTGGLRFVTLYLLSYGAVKVFLMFALLKNKLWAYPISIALFSTFLLYQLYRIGVTHSVALMIVTIIDILALAFIAHEYYHARKAVGAVE